MKHISVKANWCCWKCHIHNMEICTTIVELVKLKQPYELCSQPQMSGRRCHLRGTPTQLKINFKVMFYRILLKSHQVVQLDRVDVDQVVASVFRLKSSHPDCIRSMSWRAGCFLDWCLSPKIQMFNKKGNKILMTSLFPDWSKLLQQARVEWKNLEYHKQFHCKWSTFPHPNEATWIWITAAWSTFTCGADLRLRDHKRGLQCHALYLTQSCSGKPSVHLLLLLFSV